MGDSPVLNDIYASPSGLNIKKNTVVEFVNHDDRPHIVMYYDGPAGHLFKSGEIEPGKKWRYKFTEPGVYYIKSVTKPYVGAVVRVGR